MNEKIVENIDRYLRKEMSADESIRFEQGALNDNDLRREIELTYIIKKGIIDRQRKLHQIKHWERKGRNRTVILAAVASVAAMFVGGIFVLQPELHLLTENTATSVEELGTENVFEKNEQTIHHVKNSIEKRNDYEIIAVIDSLEQNRIISPLNDISENRLFMNYKMTKEENLILNNDSYELHWRKICSLIKVGKVEEAKKSLLRFVNIDGKYKSTADSLLQTLK